MVLILFFRQENWQRNCAADVLAAMGTIRL